MVLEHPPQVLFVSVYGTDRDAVFPIGLIQAANQLSAPKRGVLYQELTPESLRGVKVVVLHAHWDGNVRYLQGIIRTIRKHAATATIIVGGYLSTVHSERLVRDYDIDYCIVRDYELPFKELVEAVLAGKQPDWIHEHVPNLVGKRGPSRREFRMSPSMLNDLDGLTLDWFPSLLKYAQFQDLLNELGIDKWAEEQYLPSIVIKGSFNRMCSYCTLSTQDFRKFCTAKNYTYLEEEQFVRLLDQYEGWRGVNVFGDFCALDLDKILALMKGKKYSFELTLGDLFKKIDEDKLFELASHFKKVWAVFSTLPLSCYLGKKKITLSLFDVERDRALFKKLEQRDDLNVAYWFNLANVDDDEDWTPYVGRVRRIDPWLPFPTQEPTEDDYQTLMRNTRRYERNDRERRRVSIHVRRCAPKRPRTAVEVSCDPFTIDSRTKTHQRLWRAREQRLGKGEPLRRNEFGVRVARFTAKTARRGIDLEVVSFEDDLKNLRKQRNLTIHLPPGASTYEIELRIGQNLTVARVYDEAGRLVLDELAVSTVHDLRLFAKPDRVKRVEALYALAHG